MLSTLHEGRLPHSDSPLRLGNSAEEVEVGVALPFEDPLDEDEEVGVDEPEVEVEESEADSGGGVRDAPATNDPRVRRTRWTGRRDSVLSNILACSEDVVGGEKGQDVGGGQVAEPTDRNLSGCIASGPRTLPFRLPSSGRGGALEQLAWMGKGRQ